MERRRTAPSSVEPGAAAYNAPKVTGADTGDGLG